MAWIGVDVLVAMVCILAGPWFYAAYFFGMRYHYDMRMCARLSVHEYRNKV